MEENKQNTELQQEVPHKRRKRYSGTHPKKFSEKYKELNVEYFDETSLIYKIPFGIIYDIPILVGIGPSIPFKVNVLSSVNSSINTNVKEYGINNSLIELILNIELTIQIILPFSSENKKIEKQIPLDTKIIQGKIPEYYGGFISNKTS